MSVENKFDKNLLAYRLATTDLFVEKAIIHLEHDYNKYLSYSQFLTKASFFPLIVGVVASFNSFWNNKSELANTITEVAKGKPEFISQWLAHESMFVWFDFTTKFVAGFTFYGFLVLTSVACWRHAKAMMDQAERLKERRHSLRQGRLYIHLNDGKVNSTLSDFPAEPIWRGKSLFGITGFHG